MSQATLGSVLAAAVALVVGAATGFEYGGRHARARAKLGALYAVSVVACLGLCALGLAIAQRWLAVGSLGLLGGLLTGLKYGARGGFMPQEPQDKPDSADAPLQAEEGLPHGR